MQLHLAAVTHCDPLARRRLAEWMRQAAARCSTPPAFVAVEWGRKHFEVVRAQRGRFIDICRARWPAAPQDLLAELSLTMGFEAETHSQIWPQVPTVWLDDDRSLSEEEQLALQTYAEQRVVMYRSWLEDEQPQSETEAAVMFLSAIAETVTRGVIMPNGHVRDGGWAATVLDHWTSGEGWALAVVGEAHANDDPASFASQLRVGGVRFEVHYMFERY